jgi:putative nucleotidyltransferase with HDIG domain
MIKKIPVEWLQIGMYVHDLNCGWADHDFILNRFHLKTDKQIEKIRKIGIREIYIDTSKGIDHQEAPTIEEVKVEIKREIIETITDRPPQTTKSPPSASIPLKVEIAHAVDVRKEALKVAHNILGDVRLGKQVDVGKMGPVVEEITQSVFLNPDALITLCRIKDADNYTFQHCVSLCALMASFANSMGMDSNTVWDASTGGLFHDVGKMKIPESILNKPGKLTDQEFEVMKSHVTLGVEIMTESNYTPSVVMQIVGEHHERFDGTGYPWRIDSSKISLLGKMAAIVDVYDAITSNRVYHQGLPPHEAIRKLYEWSSFHFDRSLVEQFIRVVGIYPVGSAVNTTSGKAGIVIDQRHDDLLHPVLCILYDNRRKSRVPPHRLDLADAAPISQGETIVDINENIISSLNINPMDYL